MRSFLGNLDFWGNLNCRIFHQKSYPEYRANCYETLIMRIWGNFLSLLGHLDFFYKKGVGQFSTKIVHKIQRLSDNSMLEKPDISQN